MLIFANSGKLTHFCNGTPAFEDPGKIAPNLVYSCKVTQVTADSSKVNSGMVTPVLADCGNVMLF